MDVDDDGTQRPAETDDFGIEPDFDELEDEDKEVSGSRVVCITAADARVPRQRKDEEVGRDFEAQIARMRADLERLVPNMKAGERLADVQTGLEEAEREGEDTRRESKRAKDEFQAIKKKRSMNGPASGHLLV